ncbi:hypothetical protein ZWY2020_023332 [Hordeum vulgare]|nr:hypothetical protein ZWY2020_023332 [Hordeum vulgare]
MKKIQQKTETIPLLLLRQAKRRVTPYIGVKTRRNKKKDQRGKFRLKYDLNKEEHLPFVDY